MFFFIKKKLTSYSGLKQKDFKPFLEGSKHSNYLFGLPRCTFHNNKISDTVYQAVTVVKSSNVR